MSNLWSPVGVCLQPNQAIGSDADDQVISKPFRITAGGSTSLVAIVETADVVKGNGITIKFQTGIDGIFYDTKSVAIENNGTFVIRFNNNVNNDHQYLPLLASGRLTVSTTNNATLTITCIKLLQAD